MARTVDLMLVHLLAARPGPAALLDACLEHALSNPDDRDLRGALLINPAVPLAARTNLFARTPDRFIRQQLIAHAAQVLPTQDVLGLLHDETAVCVLAAAAAAPDPDGVIARWVHQRSSAIQVAYALLASPTCPHPIKLDAVAHVLARPNARPTTATGQDIANTILTGIDQAQTPQEEQTAKDLLTRALQCPMEVVVREVDRIQRTRGRRDQVGDPAWFQNAPTCDVLTYVSGRGGPSVWLKALRHHPDPTGVLAQEAWNRCQSPAVVRVVATRPTAPVAIRQKAAWRLSTLSDHIDTTRAAATWLVGHGEVDWAVRYATRWNRVEPLEALRARTDLTGEHLEAVVHAYQRRLVNDGADRCWYPTVMWGLAVATNPNASPTLRTTGAELAALPAPTNWGGTARITGQMARTMAAIAAGDQIKAPARVGGQLPVPALNDSAMLAIPGVRRLVTAALDEFPPHVADAARSLVRLADDFTGTLAELLDVAAAVAA